MIKVIAFDFVGVLVKEKDIELNKIESKLERLFGPNLNDKDYIIEARKLIKNDSTIIKTTKEIINKLYEIKYKDIFSKIKEKYPDKLIIIATNHLSFVRNFINNISDINNYDDLIISADINKIKPNKDFYEYILNKFNLKPCELLFLDDNKANVDGAASLKIQTIKVDKTMNDLFKIICNYIDSQE